MGGGGGVGKAPKIPKIPTPSPPAASVDPNAEAQAKDEAAKIRKQRLLSSGRQSTILTGGEGLGAPAPGTVQIKQLLGQ